MRKQLQPKRVKSAERVLQVLEYFDGAHQQAKVMDIARALDLPQSSTSELLKCITAKGYLVYDPYRRSYRPTARVALLGAAVEPALFRSGKLLDMMEELGEMTSQFVIAGMLVGLNVRYIHVIRSPRDTRIVVPEISKLLPHTSMGQALLAPLPNETIRKLIHRHNAEVDARWRVNPHEFLSKLDEVRAQGHAATRNTVWRNGGMISIAMPETGNGPRIGVGIGADARLIRQHETEFAALLRATIHRYFGDMVSSASCLPTLREPPASTEFKIAI